MSSTTRSILGTFFVLVIACCAVFIVSTWKLFGRMDFTEDKLYTLTKGTRSILHKIDQPLTAKLFYAKTAADRSNYDALLPYNNYYYYVRDLLESYADASQGKLAFEQYDPRPFSDAEAEADRLRMRRIPIQEGEGYYFGLSIESDSGGRQVLPFLDPREQELIEYKISEAIDLVGRQKKTKLGVLSSLSITGGGMSEYMRRMMAMQGRQPEQPWLIHEQLGKLYEVSDVAKDAEEIPSDLDYLLVVHPKDLPEKTVYAIDQFVVGGGKAIVMVDPHCMADPPAQNPNNPFGGGGESQASSLEKLLNAWGVTVASNEFAGDLSNARRLAAGRNSAEVVRFPGALDFSADRDGFNQSEVVAGGLSAVTMLFPGAIKKFDGGAEGIEVVPLIQTGTDGNTWTAQSWELGGPMGMDVARLAAKFQPGNERLTVAARLTGRFKSAFDKKPGAADDAGDKNENGDPKAEDANAETEGPPPADAEKEDEAKDGHVAEASEPNTVFVIADVDVISDQVAYQQTFFGATPVNSNSALLLNCLDQLAGSTDLMSIRSRARFRRPFTVVDDIERDADLRTREQVARINAEIEKFEADINELNNQATEKNVGLLQDEAIQKQRDLERNVREKRRELREVQQGKIGAIEAEGAFWKNLTRVWVPLLVLALGVALAIHRYSVRKVTVLGGAS